MFFGGLRNAAPSAPLVQCGVRWVLRKPTPRGSRTPDAAGPVLSDSGRGFHATEAGKAHVTKAEAFRCQHCEAEYEVAYGVGIAETGSRDCDNCGKQMAAWQNSTRPVFLRRSSSDAKPLKP